jgi:hypothetical protein
MARFHITAPDGSKYEITAPDGASEQDAIRFLQGKLGKSSKSGQLSWADVPGQALANTPESAVKFAEGVVYPLTHPIETMTAFRDIGHGLISKMYGAAGGQQDPAQKAKTEAAANALGQFFADRYGSVKGFKKTLASDPVGVLADASMVLSGGAALGARAPGVIGNAARTAGAVANTIDPLAATGRAISRSGNLVSDILGMTTGVGARPFREAFDAGRNGNQVFAQNMRREVPVIDVVDMADNAVGQLTRERSAAYNRDMAATRNGSPRTVDINPIRAALKQARDETHYSGVPIDQHAAQVLDRINEVVDNFANIPGPSTPARFDAMKRAIGEIRQRTQQGTLERRVTDNIYNSIRNEITAQVPEYAAAMRNYSEASDLIEEMRRTMSINDRAMPDTTLRKLQSTMRNNVNTNYGAREHLLDELAQRQPNLPAALAGQALNAWAPRGLARAAGPIEAGLAIAHMNPMLAAGLPLSSPRIMGEASYGMGRAVGGVENALARSVPAPAFNAMTPDNALAAYRQLYGIGAAPRALNEVDVSTGEIRPYQR